MDRIRARVRVIRVMVMFRVRVMVRVIRVMVMFRVRVTSILSLHIASRSLL
jgi:hypothetical protein